MKSVFGLRSKLQEGYVLPLVVVVSVIILSGLGIWYRQVILQSYLSERLLKQRIMYNECKSLLPLMRPLLSDLSTTDLGSADEAFYVVENAGKSRWRIERSRWDGRKVKFTFNFLQGNREPIVLTVDYFRD